MNERFCAGGDNHTSQGINWILFSNWDLISHATYFMTPDAAAAAATRAGAEGAVL